MTDTQVVSSSTLLQRVVATLDIFPLSRAGVIQSVMGLTQDLETGLDKLAKAISADPALTGRVLRLSNSPFYGRSRQVASLQQAIMILGFQTIRSLVVATSTAAMFKHGGNQHLLEELWRHSLAVAVGSRIIAQRYRPALREEAFITGLMHDIAKAVLIQRFYEEYEPVLQRYRKLGAHETAAEQDLLGFTHAELGGHVLRHWNFPADLVDATRRHHDDDGDGSQTPDAQHLTRIVAFADALAKAKDYQFLIESAADLESLAESNSFNYNEETIRDLGEQLDIGFAQTAELITA
jgi:putative nucleotidyltransferase with HDIG domain